MIRALVAALALTAECVAAQAPAEPDGYRMEDFRTPVPETLAGAEVVTTDEAEALWEAGATAFIDVLPRRIRPENLPEGTIWRDKPRDTIPGAIWLANAGYGALAAPMAAKFRAALDAAAGEGGLLFFCLRDCWMSWNAAKRAVEWGHAPVYWYPDGTDGWEEAFLPLERVAPAEGF